MTYKHGNRGGFTVIIDSPNNIGHQKMLRWTGRSYIWVSYLSQRLYAPAQTRRSLQGEASPVPVAVPRY